MIAEAYISKFHRSGAAYGSLLPIALVGNWWGNVKYIVYTSRTGAGFGKNYDKIGKIYQSQQDLVHIVYQGYKLALGNCPRINIAAAEPQNSNNGKIYHHKGKRIKQRRNLSHSHLRLHQLRGFLPKVTVFVFLPCKRPYHSNSRQILTSKQRDLVQLSLYLLVLGNSAGHYQVDYKPDNRRRHCKNKGQIKAYGKAHNDRAHNDKGTAEKQAQKHIDACLRLIYVVGYPCYHGGSAYFVYFRVRQAV